MPSSTRRPPLRWRKQPSERGLARIGQLPRGVDLRRGGECLACVRPTSQSGEAWFWRARIGDESTNTACRPQPTIEEAQAEAEAWVREREAEGEYGQETVRR